MLYPFLPVLTFFFRSLSKFQTFSFELWASLYSSLPNRLYRMHQPRSMILLPPCIPMYSRSPHLSHIEIVWTMLKSQVHPSKPSHLMNCGQIFRRNCARIMLIATECLWLRWILQSDIQPNTNEATWVYRSYNFDSVLFRDTPPEV